MSHKQTGKKADRGDNSVLAEEYRVLHEVAQTLHAAGGIKEMLKNVLTTLTQFEELRVERKAGIFLADSEKKVLRLFCTIGEFSEEFLHKEKEVPYGSCLCGRVAELGSMLMSESCFTDPRHERTFTDMTAHGHYIVPLKSGMKLQGVMFLYTNTYPSWYQHSQEVLLSIGGLIGDAIARKWTEEELGRYRDYLEEQVSSRTRKLTEANAKLIQEIEEHRNTHEHLLASREKLRNFSRQIQSIREEEKSSLAREVHDELGQALTALKMDLLHMERKLTGEAQDFRDHIQSMTRIVDNTIKSVQRIATELRPPILDAFGLCEAIAWQAGEYRKRMGIEFDLNCLEEHISLDKNLKTTLFRIFQETLTNIARHAGASQVRVSLSKVGDQLVLVISDDGRGITRDEIENPQSLGLVGIRERVLSCRGDLHIEGNPGRGTTITVTVPAPSS